MVISYCKFGNFREGFIFTKFAYAEFSKIKPSRNRENSLSFTDVGKSCQSREFLQWQICLLTLFAKISEFTVVCYYVFLCLWVALILCWGLVLVVSFRLFLWFDFLCPINNLSVIKQQIFLGWTSTKVGLMCLAKGHNPVRLEPVFPRFRVKHSTTEPLHSHIVSF